MENQKYWEPTPSELRSGARLGGFFKIRCYDPEGNLKWEDVAKNVVVNEGLQHILDILFVSATTQIDPWYVGLMGATPSPAAGDTLTTHGGWTEFQDYSEWTTRQTFVDSRSSQQVDNNGNEAAFSIDTNSSTIGGAFLCSAQSGTSGTLLCAAAFSGGNKSADDGDTLEVEYQFSAADDGA